MGNVEDIVSDKNLERLNNLSKMLNFHLAEAERLRKEMTLIMQSESYQKTYIH